MDVSSTSLYHIYIVAYLSNLVRDPFCRVLTTIKISSTKELTALLSSNVSIIAHISVIYSAFLYEKMLF